MSSVPRLLQEILKPLTRVPSGRFEIRDSARPSLAVLVIYFRPAAGDIRQLE
jgi:hypothetical protein